MMTDDNSRIPITTIMLVFMDSWIPLVPTIIGPQIKMREQLFLK